MGDDCYLQKPQEKDNEEFESGYSEEDEPPPQVIIYLKFLRLNLMF